MTDELPDLDIDVAAIEAEVSDEATATASLRKLQSGGAVLVALVQTRLAEAMTAVKQGRFTDANRYIQEAAAKVGPLAGAEYGIGTFAGTTRITRAEEIEEGVMVMGMGRVVKAERFAVEHTAGRDCWHIRLHFEDGDEFETNGKREMLVERETAPDA